MSEELRTNERNIDWEEVEYKITIICNKFSTSVESRYIEDLAQELRIHAYYKSDDYYNLQRRAIDFWRSMKVNVMPEMPYFDLEFIGGTKLDDHTDVEFRKLVNLIKGKLNEEVGKAYDDEIRLLAKDVFEVILADLIEDNKLEIRESEKYAPYHNHRISCSYLWEVLGDYPGEIQYTRIRKALKMIEGIVRDLGMSGVWDIDKKYLQ